MMNWVHDMLIPQRRQNAPDDRLAKFTAYGILIHSTRLHDLCERLELLESAKKTMSNVKSCTARIQRKFDSLDDIEQICPRECEMRADVVADSIPCLLHFRL